MLPPIELFKERFGEIRYFFAPMAGISDTVFRLLMRELGAQIVVSELLSSEGLVRGGVRTHEMLSYDERERPIGIQIFGSNVQSMKEAAKIVQDHGADFVDINFGCPVRKVVCDGGGAAWLKDPIKLDGLLKEVKSGLKIPLSIKVRTGWDEANINVQEVVRVAEDNGIAWVAIHGRTRAQGYSGQANWDLIRETAQKSKIPIVGNGDIVTAEQGRKLIAEGFSHAIMIGRGALKNPWIFREIIGGETGELVTLIHRHFDIAIEKKDRRRAYLSLKKFMAWYATGLPGASQFRAKIFSTEEMDALRALAIEYFTENREYKKQLDTSPFLMGGHG